MSPTCSYKPHTAFEYYFDIGYILMHILGEGHFVFKVIGEALLPLPVMAVKLTRLDIEFDAANLK